MKRNIFLHVNNSQVCGRASLSHSLKRRLEAVFSDRKKCIGRCVCVKIIVGTVWGCMVCAPVKNVSGLIHEPCAPILAAAFVAAWDNIVLFYVVVRLGLPVRLLLSEDFVLVLFLLKAK